MKKIILLFLLILSNNLFAQTDVILLENSSPKTNNGNSVPVQSTLPYDLPLKTSSSIPIVENGQITPLTPTETNNVCTFTGQITNTDGFMTGRIFRDANPSYCGVQKEFPGMHTTSGAYYFDSYLISNTSGISKCVMFSLSPGIVSNETLHLSVYNGSFNPNNQAANYLGDLGTSPSGSGAINTSTLSMSLNVPNGTNLILVVFSPNASTFTTSPYTLTITNLSCAYTPTCTLTGTLSSTDNTSNGRIFRDANPSVCASNKAFPGVSGTGTNYNYVTQRIANYTGTSRCVTFGLTGGNNTVFMSIYNGSFDPNNLATNYLGDIGSSPTGGTNACNITVPDNTVLVLVINAVNSPLAATENYSITITNLPCMPKCSYTGIITASSSTMIGRITRDGNKPKCGVTKTFPGMNTTSGTYYYNTHRVSNNSGNSRCSTFSIKAGGSNAGEHVHLSIYNGSFDPNNQALNYVGDVGISSVSGASPITESASINIPNNTDFVLVVFTANPTTVTQNSYTVETSGLVCCPQMIASINPDNNITGIARFGASNSLGIITATNKMSASSNVLMEAGRFVLLNPGFEVNNGGVFKAQNGGCQ